MKQVLSIFSICFLVTFLGGCERIIDFKGNEPAKKLNVTAIAGCDTNIIYVEVSESYFIYTDENYIDYYETQAKLEINGEECLDFWSEEYILQYYGHSRKYGFRADFREGDIIKVTVESDKHETATGEEIVPPPPVIVDVQTERFVKGEYKEPYIRALIRIKDDPAVNNYYRLLIKSRENNSEWYIDYSIDQDLVMSSLSSQEIQDGDNNKMRIFPDDLFNGKEYTLNVYFFDSSSYYEYEEDYEVIIELQSLSESLYLHMRSLEMSYNSDIFSEPVRIYSNIKGGYGIMGTYNYTKYVLEY